MTAQDIPADVAEKARALFQSIACNDDACKIVTLDSCGCFKAIALALLAERREAEQRAWQPIETAPRDGTRILVGGIQGGIWGYGVAWWTEGNFGEDFYADRSAERPHWHLTHWQPLPAPPATTAEPAKGA